MGGWYQKEYLFLGCEALFRFMRKGCIPFTFHPLTNWKLENFVLRIARSNGCEWGKNNIYEGLERQNLGDQDLVLIFPFPRWRTTTLMHVDKLNSEGFSQQTHHSRKSLNPC